MPLHLAKSFFLSFFLKISIWSSFKQEAIAVSVLSKKVQIKSYFADKGSRITFAVVEGIPETKDF